MVWNPWSLFSLIGYNKYFQSIIKSLLFTLNIHDFFESYLLGIKKIYIINILQLITSNNALKLLNPIGKIHLPIWITPTI